MHLRTFSVGWLLLLLLCPQAVASANGFANPGADARQVGTAQGSHGAVLGPADAPIDLVVFMNFGCTYSKSMFFELEKLEERYPSQVRLEIKQLPLPIHPKSAEAHEAALAAGAQGKYFPMARLIFANQDNLDEPVLLAYARQLGLDIPRFQRDIGNHTYRAVIQQDVAEANAFGVKSTPATFLNGHRLDGFQTADALSAQLENELKVFGDAKASMQTANAELSNPDSGNMALPAKLAAKLVEPGAEVRGDARAPVTIVEFSDFQCPFCSKAAGPLQQLLEDRKGTVRLVYRSFPLSFHHDSELANEAALAAGAQGSFWPMHDLIFANQHAIKRDDLLRYAAELHLDMASFRQALDSHRYAGRIAADLALGEEAGVDGTPTLFVNGRRLSGAHSITELEQIVDQQARLIDGKSPNGSGLVVANEAVAETDETVLGTAGSPVRIAWFTDVRSPLARRQAELMHDLATAYPERVRIVFKALPLQKHSDDDLTNRALLAAAKQNMFWPMLDQLIAHPEILSRPALLRLAADTTLDVTAFETALDAPETARHLQMDADEGLRRGMRGAPVLLINGKRVDGIQKLAYYRSMIDSELAGRSSMLAGKSGQ